jgi:hypothetical protein
MKLLIGFSTPKTWKIGAEAIKLWIRKPYSHVFVAWKSERFSQVLVYHAAHGSVHFLSMERLLKENRVVRLYELEITEEQHTALVSKCIDLAGERYGYIELLKIFVKDVCDLLSIQCTMIHNDRGYICSELLAELLSELGAKFDRPLFLIRPDHIEQAVISMAAKEEVL